MVPKLNKEQRQAVTFGKGHLLIIAGAGTGKTTVITERIKYLILKKKILPGEILALTFTEKASREMQERVDVALPYGYSQMWISTFHSFGDRVLRNEAVHIGLDPKYSLMTEAEAIRFMREHLFEFNLHYFRPLGNPTKFLSGIFQHFSRLKDEDISQEEYLKFAKDKIKKAKTKEEKLEGDKWLELAEAYKTYEDQKSKEGAVDFADLISNTLRLFRMRPNILEKYRKQFKYILVDEFQDTNIAQNELIKLLAGKKGNLTVVADDDQSIYKWRGAAVSNVIQFRKSFPRSKLIVLKENYRSTQEILDSAYRLIQNNNPDRLEVKEKIDKKLSSARKEKGEKLEFIHLDRVENEADAVAKKIIQLIELKKGNFSDFAILVRANNHAEPFTRALARHGIPYQFLGPGQLFRQEEVKEIIAYLKVLYNFEDSTSFYKVLTMEHFDISARALAEITNYARKRNTSLFEACEKAADLSLSDEIKRKVDALVKMIHQHLKLIPKETAGQIAYYFLKDSGLLKLLLNPKNIQDEKRAQNIARFFDKLKTYEVEHEDASVFAVVDWIDLSMELGESPLATDFDWTHENAVNILTVHSSKGLEFPIVFVVNLVADRFPTRERREQIPIPDELIKEVLPQGDFHTQEERRLFYVAMTRAKDSLYLTAADYYGEGKRERKISPFVVEAIGPSFAKATEGKEGEQLSILDFSPPEFATTRLSISYKLPAVSYLSYSQIDTFRFCPLHYKMKYILNVPTAPTAAQSFGTTLHQTLQEFYERLLRGVKQGEKELLELYDKNWIPEGFLSKPHERKMKKRGEEYLAAYLKSDTHNPKNPPVALERPFTFPLVPNLKIGGKIDRIDKTKTGIEIIDYKTTDFTSKKLPTEKELEKDLQLSIYAIAASKVYDPVFLKNKGDITLSLYFLDQQVKVSTKRTPEQLKAAKQEILKVKEEIEKSDFSCSGILWCKDCEYKLFCEVNN